MILLSYNLKAQEKSAGILQAGIGRTFIGAGDYLGAIFFVQYRNPLSDLLSLTPRISTLMAASVRYLGEAVPGEEIYSSSSGIALDLDLNYAPIRRFKDNIFFSVGPTVRYHQQSHPRNVSKRTFPDGSTTFEVGQQFYSGYAIGATVAVNLEYNISPKSILGSRASLQVYTDDSVVPFYGLTYGYRLD